MDESKYNIQARIHTRASHTACVQPGEVFWVFLFVVIGVGRPKSLADDRVLSLKEAHRCHMGTRLIGGDRFARCVNV